MCMNVLLVDDDPDYLSSMRLQLEHAGHTVTTAETMAEADAYLKEHRPDLAVIDLMIEQPDDGFVLCHRIKKRHPTVPVIMVTSVHSETGYHFEAATNEERVWIKADALLPKPVTYEQLRREINRLAKE